MKRQIQIPTHFANGQRTHWPEMITKIANRLSPYPIGAVYKLPQSHYDFDGLIQGEYQPKIHHIIPTDFECDPGDDLEFIAVTPEGGKFLFAPLVKCVGVQEFRGHFYPQRKPWLIFNSDTKNSGHQMTLLGYQEFVRNEGCENWAQIWTTLFKEERNPYRKLIHWTDKRY